MHYIPAAYHASVNAPLRGVDLQAEGCPFYAGRLRFHCPLTEPLAGRLQISRPADSRATALAVELPDGTVHWFPPAPYALEFTCDRPISSFDLLLCGHPGNLLGPHLAVGLPGGWTWEQAPESPPPASAYRFRSTGIRGTFTVHRLTP